MRGRLTSVALAILALGAGGTGVAAASPRDTAATHAYLVADYAVLHSTVSKWSVLEANIAQLDARYQRECAHIGAGSPQSEEEQKLSMEVAGALWTAGYRTNAKAVKSFIARVGRLSWSNSKVTRAARSLTSALHAMVTLEEPDLCGDVRAWAAGGYQAVSIHTDQYARHVEAIEVHQIPRRLLAPYLSGSDAALAARVQRLDRRYEELEFVHGQDQWNKLLEVLALNQ
jgi:hypothetical protein